MISVWATLALGLSYLIRWPFTSWRNFRRTLVGFAILATLVAIFYAEENWRGKRAWENCKRELEAKGAVLDWNKYIPPPVPDDQNFFTVNTNFYLRFVKLHTAEQSDALSRVQWLNLSNGFPILDLAKVQPVVAEIIATAPSAKVKSGIAVNDANTRQQLQDSLRSIVGRSAIGSAGFHFSELPLSHPTPVQIPMLADRPISLGEMENWIPQNLFTNIGKLAVSTTADPNIFQLKFTSGRITGAADYLAWGDRQFGSDLDDVRAALKRPWAMIPGNYTVPHEMPIPNFVLLRLLAQTLAQRTQCHLLLHEPEQAMHELALIHDVCRILERPLTGKPMTLVEAMINTAITGLYVAAVQEGFRLHEWQEPQLVAIQNQMAAVSLPPLVLSALETELPSVCHSIETTPMSKILNVASIVSPNKKHTLWDMFQKLPSRMIDLAPHGWVYQNMVVYAELMQLPCKNLLDEEHKVIPKRVDWSMNELSKAIENNYSPFAMVAKIGVPNLSKAMQSCSFTQTLANQAQIVCALERYKLANGNYPDALATLVPQFIEKMPNDIIGGQPLHYQRTTDGNFLLYSVGWDEKDDGGRASSISNNGRGATGYAQGDWVWPFPAK